ncbi:MAG: glycosyltransferase family 39 protein [Candidatus Brocadiia bacterium]
MPRAWPFILIIAVAVVVRVAVFRGFAASDDADYARVAWDIAQGHSALGDTGVPPQYSGRLGIAAPVGLLFRAFGVHEWTLLIFPAVMSAAMLALAYAFGRTFFSREAGLITMAIFAVMPIDCRFATWLLSDIPSAAWAGGGILALIMGKRTAKNGGKAFAGLMAALCFGLSWLTRTQVAQLAPFVVGALAIWSWRDRKNLWLAGPAAAGVLAICLIEGFCYLSATGDFLYPLHSAERVYVMHSQWYYFTEGGVYGWAPGHYALGLARRLLLKGPAGLLLNADFALVPLAALAAAAHVLYWRRREFLFPAALFLWSALVFNFGSASLRHYEPLPWVSSYMVPCLLPAAALTGGWLAWLLSSREENARVRRERRFWAALVCAVLALAAAFGLYQEARQGVGCPVTRQAAKSVSPDSDRPLYSDAMTLRGLEFFWGYRATRPMRDFGRMSAEEVPAGAEVLINPPEIQRMRDQVGYQPPPWTEKPPAQWMVEQRWDGAALYIARR